jgi:hypothetical protein
VAGVLVDRGELDRAEEVLSGLTGPRSGLVRGRLWLMRGDISRARIALMGAAPSLQGAEGTETLALVTLLGRLSADGAKLLGRAMQRAAAGQPAEAITLLGAEAGKLPAAERPAILEYAAGLADRAKLPAESERLRRSVIIEYPNSPETPAALLALARMLVERGDSPEEARQLLERLILDHPRSALLPQARRELDRLQGRVPSS